MTPEELKQQAHKEFDELSIKLECEEMPELASLLQKLSDTAFEKQKVQVYKMLDSLIDRTVQATKEKIAQDEVENHVISFIVNKSNTNK